MNELREVPERGEERVQLAPRAVEPASSRAPAPSLTRTRKLLALSIAALSDALSVFLEFTPPLEWALDGATALALFAVLGFRWPLLPVLVVEAVPGLAAFPTWLVVVGVLVARAK